jgi:hypothetical protein
MGRFRSPFHHPLAALRFAILISAFIVSGYLLLAIARYESTTPYLDDTPTFMAVGRALLNGRELYSQVLETKPPGIFVLAAMSLAMHDHWPRLFDTTSLLRILQLCAYVILLAACVVPRLPGGANSQNRTHRFLFGIVIVVMTAAFAGQGMPESFGAAFGAAYVAAFVRLDGSIKWRHAIGLGILLAIAIGFKEPFAVSVVAASIACSRHGFNSFKAVGLSLVAAAFFGITCLSLAGWLDDYMLSYIPYMITERIPLHMQREFWKQVVDVRWVIGSAALLSPLFPVLLYGLVAGAGGIAGGPRVSVRRIVALAAALIWQ